MRAFAAALLVACSSAPGAQSDEFPAAVYATTTSADGDLVFDARTAPTQPPIRGDISLMLTVADSRGAPVDGLTLDVVPWMPAMGHGASAVPMVTPRGNGDYLVDNLVLVMPGMWELRVTTSDASMTVIPIRID